MRTTKQFYVASLILMSGIFGCQDGIEKTEPEAQKNIINDEVRDSANGRVANSIYWDRANQVHNFVVGNLLTQYNSYRANTTTNYNNAWQWYQISQIQADAEMIRQGDTRYAPYMNNTYSWMGNMWHSSSPTGGYFASANLDGTGAGGDKYIDDNSLAGVTYLECYNVTTGTQKTSYLNSAKATANWLMNSGMWDNTFGGGFWWNTAKPVKPTQSNGLAMQLFIRLYGITGQSFYLSWANSVRTWLEANMFDATDGLFIWQIEANGTRRMDKFTYDNAIMIEAYLDFYKVTGDNNYRMKAINLAIKLNSKLWDYTKNVYKFNTNDPRVNPAWCGWASQSMIKLYKSDPNTAWLDYAQKNIDFLNTYNRNASNGGYYAFTNLNGSISDNRYEGVDQAWMQRINAEMAEYR
jgi:uncharacterized protein YyaL (SSP411 family)